jgi:5-methylcytosine-specific restriction enzyme subunit McrC
MEALFEAYVKRHLSSQLRDGFVLKAQTSTRHLVSHRDQNWFRLKPDFLVNEGCSLSYGYQVEVARWVEDKRYGKVPVKQGGFLPLVRLRSALPKRQGDVVLIYPKTDAFFETASTAHSRVNPHRSQSRSIL